MPDDPLAEDPLRPGRAVDELAHVHPNAEIWTEKNGRLIWVRLSPDQIDHDEGERIDRFDLPKDWIMEAATLTTDGEMLVVFRDSGW